MQGYQGAYTMLDLEKQNLLGVGNSGASDGVAADVKGETTPLQRMQNFISSMYEDTFHALGHAFHSLPHEIYNIPNLAPTLIATVFSNLEVSFLLFSSRHYF